jgi:hypothetical protein
MKDRGVITEGAYTDISLIDLSHLRARHYPEGIIYVLINGKTKVEEGKHKGATPVKILRRKY